jgi:threonylcarbamoyladenosine tRNA methylthiotransferase MtaB
VNRYETEYLREALRRIGYANAAPHETADLVIINTCTVTAESDRKSRKLIRQLAKLNPNAEIVVAGCYAAHAADEIRKMPQVGEIITDKRALNQFLQRRGVVDLPDGISSFDGRRRAFVKVQDGCRVGCSYCIIPKVRPYLSSRSAPEILNEIRRLLDAGYREIVLTGIHLGHYGLDFERDPQSQTEQKNLAAGNIRLSQLIEQILNLDAANTFRVRASSMEAAEVSDELIELMQAFPQKFCPHLHLSMQSGSDTVLRKMRRRWLSQPFEERCRQIQEKIDRAALTTDAIVGFPGETEREFLETCELAERIGFSKVHVFPFSPREGVEAATFPDQIPEPEKERRASHLIQLAQRLRADFAKSLVGQTSQILWETTLKKNSPQKPQPTNNTNVFLPIAGQNVSDFGFDSSMETLAGTCGRYMRVSLQTESSHAAAQIGQLADVSIIASHGGELVGKMIDNTRKESKRRD